MFGKQKFVTALANELNITEDLASSYYDAFINIVKEAAEVDTVRLAGIGVLRKNDIPAHEARNPATGVSVGVPARFNYRLSSPTQDL